MAINITVLIEKILCFCMDKMDYPYMDKDIDKVIDKLKINRDIEDDSIFIKIILGKMLVFFEGADYGYINKAHKTVIFLI